MKIAPIKFYSNQSSQKKVNLSFSSSAVEPQPSPQMQNFYVVPPLSSIFPRVKDKNILEAINHLNHLEFDKNDVEHVQSLGVVLPFFNGKDALGLIKKSRIDVKFAPLASNSVHAQYDYDDNCIKINQIYKETRNPAEIFAIAEAILHEAGHAKDYDSASSLQEEIDCLALNALSHRVYSKQFPDLFKSSDSLIIKDGVCVYGDLFFDDDPLKMALIKRLRLKYGHLPAGDLTHPPSNIALKIKES